MKGTFSHFCLHKMSVKSLILPSLSLPLRALLSSFSWKYYLSLYFCGIYCLQKEFTNIVFYILSSSPKRNHFPNFDYNLEIRDCTAFLVYISTEFTTVPCANDYFLYYFYSCYTQQEIIFYCSQPSQQIQFIMDFDFLMVVLRCPLPMAYNK